MTLKLSTKHPLVYKRVQCPLCRQPFSNGDVINTALYVGNIAVIHVTCMGKST